MKKHSTKKLAAITGKDESNWREVSRWRRENRSWLKRSSRIAVRVSGALRAQNMTQKQLAERMGLSSQYVSRIIKGQENLTLDQIARLEAALGITLIQLAVEQSTPEFIPVFMATTKQTVEPVLWAKGSKSTGLINHPAAWASGSAIFSSSPKGQEATEAKSFVNSETSHYA